MTDGRFSFGGLQDACPVLPGGGLEPLECVPAAAGTLGLVALGAVVLFGAYRFLRERSNRQKAGPLMLFSRQDAPQTPPSPWQAQTPGTQSFRPRGSSSGRATERERAPTPRPRFERSPTGSRSGTSGPVPSAGEPRDGSPTQRTIISPEMRAAATGSAPKVGNRRAAATDEMPPDGTLQLLPGSLTFERGDRAGEQIRFVRVPGEEVVITFGRSPGTPHRHVQLDSVTVSRIHARLTFRDRKWTLRNESATNPTVVNGRPLEGSPAEVLLRDGDRIEMGDVVFAFKHSEPSNRLALRSSWYTDRGRRPTNQDAVAVRTLPEGRELAVVCDGMGSHASGGMASYIALEAMVESLTSGEDLAEAVQEANRAVRRAAEGNLDHDGMGTTIVALLREGERYMVANVGDSRAYRVDRKGIRQLTRDHSFVAEAVAEGGMSPEEANSSPWRNAVTRNLGTEGEVEVDLFGPFDATSPHLAILSTDGVHGVLSDEEIERLVGGTSEVRDLARALAEAALSGGGDDNVAVAVMDFSVPQEAP